MKKLILSTVTIIVLGLLSCKNETKEKSNSVLNPSEVKEVAMATISFGVRGNCGMCKKTIEKAVNSLEGISKANWDVDAKKMDVSFDDSKTNEMAIHNAIAASGYDTEKVSADLDAYNGLPGCCQYDHDMVMNHME
ncbi:heavy-metal-associated domain-containing protein [Gaetbulibacter aquiaggeris]|uniref:Heavy-metal-associated domain-containing protein n=1 Tax=Gaetbulibacter aquiaggeris TaxID=1735373 RepID=A0ABW7MPK1_9FLAO